MSGEPLEKIFLEVTIMCGNNGFFGGNCCWLIIILLLIFFCGNGQGNGCGTQGIGCGCERTCC